MKKHHRLIATAALLTGALISFAARAEISDGVVKLGVLTDMSGVYSTNSGAGMLLATEMAVADFGGTVRGRPIKVISGDHQNKADVGSNLARKWIDTEQVDVIVDAIGSAVAFAVQNLAKDKNRVLLNIGSGAADLTGPACNAVSVQWVWDTYAFGGIIGNALVERGKDTFFFVTVDYAYGEQLQRDMSRAILGAGGKVVGSVKHPLGTSDFSSFLLQAQASKAKVVALANAGNDTANALKQAAEFNLRAAGQDFAAIAGLHEVRAIGLPAAQGLLSPVSWYWDLDDQTRAFAKRFFEKRGAMPSEFQAGAYSAVLHYLKAVDAADSDEAQTVVRKMKELPVSDFFARHASLREDGRMIHDMYLVQAKTPAESRDDWDVLKVVQTIPGDKAFRPLKDGNCPLVAK
ncbi:MAG: ABC transporter substrate-binding protein [Ferrovibrionaceae bacterium]